MTFSLNKFIYKKEYTSLQLYISLSSITNCRKIDNTYGTWTGNSGPKSLLPSQKQSSGVMMAQGIILSKICEQQVNTFFHTIIRESDEYILIKKQ